MVLFYMCSEAAFKCTIVPTNFTVKRFFTCVKHSMTLQLRSITKKFKTIFTLTIITTWFCRAGASSWFICMCFFKPEIEGYLCPHTSQEKSISAVLPVLYRLYLSGNIFLQSLHQFSLLSSNTAEWPSCISRKVFLWCLPRGPFSFASFLHRRQRCLIPEWSEFLCLFKVPFLWNAFPQSAHWYDLYAFSHEALCHNL